MYKYFALSIFIILIQCTKKNSLQVTILDSLNNPIFSTENDYLANLDMDINSLCCPCYEVLSDKILYDLYKRPAYEDPRPHDRPPCCLCASPPDFIRTPPFSPELINLSGRPEVDSLTFSINNDTIRVYRAYTMGKDSLKYMVAKRQIP